MNDDIVLDVGLASLYFLTSVESNKAFAAIERPYVVVSNETLKTQELSECLAAIHNHTNASGFLNFGAKKLGTEEVKSFLEDVICDKKTRIVLNFFRYPILIIANGFEKRALAATKVLKIRGIGSFVGLDASGSLEAKAAVMGFESECEQIGSGDFYKLYKPLSRLNVVSGIRKSVLSKRLNTKQILVNYPDLLVPFDPNSIAETLI